MTLLFNLANYLHQAFQRGKLPLHSCHPDVQRWQIYLRCQHRTPAAFGGVAVWPASAISQGPPSGPLRVQLCFMDAVILSILVDFQI
jgi:hypothetical protein